MLSSSYQDQLVQLRPGDRLKYHSVEWQVKDCSNYEDPKGYEMTEWLLQSKSEEEYYLLREVDPKNPEAVVNWYLAVEISNPKLFHPELYTNLAVSLWHDMQAQKTPYPELQALSRRYYFESETRGNYEGSKGETARITWDYWDAAHQWNLALEAWPNGEFHVYSTKLVQPEEFSDIKEGGSFNLPSSFPIGEFIAACSLLLLGLFMLLLG